MTPPKADPIPNLLATVERLIEDVMALRLAIWDREWAGGRHRDAPPRPTRKKPAG